MAENEAMQPFKPIGAGHFRPKFNRTVWSDAEYKVCFIIPISDAGIWNMLENIYSKSCTQRGRKCKHSTKSRTQSRALANYVEEQPRIWEKQWMIVNQMKRNKNTRDALSLDQMKPRLNDAGGTAFSVCVCVRARVMLVFHLKNSLCVCVWEVG